MKVFPWLTRRLNWIGLAISLGLTLYSLALSREIVPQVPALFGQAEESRKLLEQGAATYRGLALTSIGVSLDDAQVRERGLETLERMSGTAVSGKANEFRSRLGNSQAPVSKRDLADLGGAAEDAGNTAVRAGIEKWRGYAESTALLATRLKRVGGLTVLFSLLTGLVLFLFNITFLAKEFSDRRLREQDKLHSRLFSTLSEGILLCRPDGTITAANQRAAQIAGWHTRQLVGENIRAVFPQFLEQEGPTVTDRREWQLETILTKGRATDALILGVISPTYDLNWLSFNAQPVFQDQPGGTFSVLFSFSDITDKISAQKEILKKRAELVEAARLSKLGEMASGIAHEINNPLTIIGGAAYRLERQAANNPNVAAEEAHSIASKISKTVDRIARVTKSMLAIARRGDLDKEDDVTIEQLIGTVRDFYEGRLERKGIALRVGEYPKDLHFTCRFVQISQVLLNLLSNAADAVTNQEGAWIRLDAIDLGEFLEFSVTDSGPGIPPEIRAKIMEPFFTTKPVGHGTGLGLSISQAVADAHKGRLYLDQGSPQTRFVLVLPKACAKTDERKDVSQAA